MRIPIGGNSPSVTQIDNGPGANPRYSSWDTFKLTETPRRQITATISTSPSATTTVGTGSAIILDTGSLATLTDVLFAVESMDIPTAVTYLTTETQSSILRDPDDAVIYIPGGATNLYLVGKGVTSVNSGIVDRTETVEATVFNELIHVVFDEPAWVIALSVESKKVSFRGYANDG